MRVQIIPSDKQKFLKEFYGCFLWKKFKVLRVLKKKTHGNCKIQKTWDEYEIEVKHTYPHNHFGQKTIIRLTDKECKIIS